VEKAISLSGDFWMNIRSKGDVYLYMGDWEKAEQEYSKLMEKEEIIALQRKEEGMGRAFGKHWSAHLAYEYAFRISLY